jgi:hypothetical protein
VGVPGSPFDSKRRIRPRPVLPSGIEAGVISGLAVSAVFLIRDVMAGEPLHTPSVLGTLLFEGLDAARNVRTAPGEAAAYNLVHFAMWLIVGSLGTSLMRLVERSVLSWYTPYLALLVLVLSGAALDAWVSETGLTRSHLWLGGLAGTVALALFLAWRHPDAARMIRRFGRE